MVQRGHRMDKNRKKKHVTMEPVVAMKVCGSISLGDQNITSKCIKAFQLFKDRYKSTKQLQDALRQHLYKDIERLIVTRKGAKEREFQKLTRHLNAKMNEVMS